MLKQSVLVFGLLGSLSAAAGPAPFPPEPKGLWPGPMQGSTPRTLTGGAVIDVATFEALVAKQHPVLIDVANIEHRPAGREAGLDWMPIHRSVPGAIWLPGAGTGHEPVGLAEAFAKRIGEATGGDKNKPIITFCHPQRWGSWNAAKRLTELGYTHVYWYPGGGEGWGTQEPMKALGEDPRWKAAGFDRSSAGDMPDGAPSAGQ